MTWTLVKKDLFQNHITTPTIPSKQNNFEVTLNFGVEMMLMLISKIQLLVTEEVKKKSRVVDIPGEECPEDLHEILNSRGTEI